MTRSKKFSRMEAPPDEQVEPAPDYPNRNGAGAGEDKSGPGPGSPCAVALPGSAYQGPGGKWVYDVPRAAFMEFVRTGMVPE